jgi:hypothetical protein
MSSREHNLESCRGEDVKRAVLCEGVRASGCGRLGWLFRLVGRKKNLYFRKILPFPSGGLQPNRPYRIARSRISSSGSSSFLKGLELRTSTKYMYTYPVAPFHCTVHTTVTLCPMSIFSAQDSTVPDHKYQVPSKLGDMDQ